MVLEIIGRKMNFNLNLKPSTNSKSITDLNMKQKTINFLEKKHRKISQYLGLSKEF